jgi:pyruvate/2-oxoglutarate dehydrogenase complex dihydrolipoamide dehydrogenase (E3) component
MTSGYDVVVIGAGSTGENVAARAVRGGLSAVVVESGLVGGECSYWACMPSKAMLRPVAVVAESGQVDGVRAAALEPAAVLARRDGFASHWHDDGQVEWLGNAAIDLIRGHARITGPRTVSAGGQRLEAGHAVVVASGSRALIPAVPGLAGTGPWTTREATSSQTIPGRLAIIGGGVAGCELAAAWQALGTQVTLLSAKRLLSRLEDFAGDLVADGLTSAGVDVRLGVSLTSAARQVGGPVQLTLSDGSQLEADEVLAATGRAPRTDDLGLETIGLEPGRWLDVDDTCRVTAVPGGWLYAAGDVNHRALLTHMGKYQGRVCGDAIAARARGEEPAALAWADHSAVPQVIFTVPEVAAAGRTQAQARDAGLNVRAVDYDLGSVAGAKLFGDSYAGRARMVVDEDRRVVVGVTLAGPGVGELIHAATIAIAGQVPLDRLWHAVPSFPTVSEIWLRLLETYGL